MNTKKLVQYLFSSLETSKKRTFSELIYFSKLFCFKTTKNLNILYLDQQIGWKEYYAEFEVV